MRLDEIARKGGNITGSEVKKRNDEYWYFLDNGKLYDNENSLVLIDETKLLADDYESYEPQIVPKEAIEIWEIKGESFVTFKGPKKLQMRGIYTGLTYQIGEEICHGQNGWTRLYPEVLDPNIERVVVHDVKFHITQGQQGEKSIRLIMPQFSGLYTNKKECIKSNQEYTMILERKGE